MFSEKIRLLRKERGWTQKDAAEGTGMSYRGIQDLEAGKKPSYDSLMKIADGFDVSVDYLMGRTEKREVNR